MKVVDFDDPDGRHAHRNLCGVALLADEINDLLTRVAEHRPGFRDRRLPRRWTSTPVVS